MQLLGTADGQQHVSRSWPWMMKNTLVAVEESIRIQQNSAREAVTLLLHCYHCVYLCDVGDLPNSDRLMTSSMLLLICVQPY
jgi:hypothetical protein